jgi:hypothetical protein
MNRMDRMGDGARGPVFVLVLHHPPLRSFLAAGGYPVLVLERLYSMGTSRRNRPVPSILFILSIPVKSPERRNACYLHS